ncbi:MAG: hypothetical protein ABW252_14385 [Polyangiales bacterium]
MARALTAILLAGASFLGLVGVADAQSAPGEVVTVVDPIDVPPEHDPLAHAWDLPGQRGGFYLRPSLSLGLQSTRLGPPSWESDLGQTASGFATGYGLDIGGYVRPWLALHLDSHLGVLWSGNLDNDLRVQGTSGPDVRILAYGFGPAVTFITPGGFYFKPALGVGFATLKSRGNDYTTDPGFYMHLVAGKDLYVDRNFSLGLQAEVVYMRLGADNESEEARVRQFLFGLSFGFDSR